MIQKITPFKFLTFSLLIPLIGFSQFEEIQVQEVQREVNTEQMYMGMNEGMKVRGYYV